MSLDAAFILLKQQQNLSILTQNVFAIYFTPNASGGCEAAVTVRVRIGWVRFRKCRELLLENRFPLKMKGKVYILYGSETWCLKENEKAILRRLESYGESQVRSGSG